MRRTISRVAASLILAGLAAACSADDGAPAAQDANADATGAVDAAPSPDSSDEPDGSTADATQTIPPDAASAGCVDWTVELDSSHPGGVQTGSTVAEGALVLTTSGDGDGTCSSNLSPCGAIMLYQHPLQGDFTVTAEVESLEGASVFGGVGLFVSIAPGISHDREISLRGSPLLMWSSHGATSASQTLQVASTAAILRIHRERGMLTLSGKSDETILATEPASFDADLYVGLSLHQSDSAEPLTARVASFVVEGGGGAVVSDTFDCAGSAAP